MKRFILLTLSLPLWVVGLAGCKTTVTFQRTAFTPLAVTARPPTAPPPPARKVEKIDIRETIQFKTGKATIKKRSHVILDEVVKVMQTRTGISKVRIEGHTDTVGDAEKNRTLSQERAQSVLEYLVKKGITRDRLEAKGYGPDKPISDNDTDEGRAKNRRVEFTILAQSATK
jgi:OmpA-OmpF porin, OOP family